MRREGLQSSSGYIQSENKYYLFKPMRGEGLQSSSGNIQSEKNFYLFKPMRVGPATVKLLCTAHSAQGTSSLRSILYV